MNQTQSIFGRILFWRTVNFIEHTWQNWNWLEYWVPISPDLRLSDGRRLDKKREREIYDTCVRMLCNNFIALRQLAVFINKKNLAQFSAKIFTILLPETNFRKTSWKHKSMERLESTVYIFYSFHEINLGDWRRFEYLSKPLYFILPSPQLPQWCWVWARSPVIIMINISIQIW